MADDEDGGVERAKERCSLLKALKRTVNRLIVMDTENNWAILEVQERIIDDIVRILRHGQRGKQVAAPGIIKSTEDGLQQALLEHSLSSYLLELASSREQLLYYYQDYAFLRSLPHVEAMLTCVKAFEIGDYELLSQIDDVLLSKRKYIESWLRGDMDISLHDVHTDIQISPDNELTSHIPVVYSDSTSSEREDLHSTPSYGSPAAEGQIDITDSSLFCRGSDIDDGVQIYAPGYGESFSCLPKSVIHLVSDSNGNGASQTAAVIDDANNLTSSRLRTTTERSKLQKNVKATLAHAALSAVMESDETSSNPTTWFGNGQHEEHLLKIRRSASTGSLNDNLLHSKIDVTDSQTSIIKPVSDGNRFEVRITPSEPQVKKVLGHYRSRSDEIGVPKSLQPEFVVDKQGESEHRPVLFSNVSRLSSSLPTTSEPLYSNDPFLEDPYEQKSLAEMLASQDFSSCEMDKENAHFSISEALIAAIEQIKCDEVDTSDEEEDEEIIHLKEKLERKRQEKKQGRLTIQQPAFSDDTTHSTTSEPSTTTTSSKSLCDSEDELSQDWEEISSTNEELQEYGDYLYTSTVTLVSSEMDLASTESVDNLETKHSTQLSAETVAKNLLQKFANRKHPVANELQWLVSYQDAPQSLLPLPETVAVAPDDVPQVELLMKNSLTRQNSLPCRIRGNSEWAPPRAQIIFHAHKPPRRKTVMAQQNFRCAGCGMAVAPDYIKRFRYCHYLGKYFCSSCHNNYLEVIPAKIVRKWDFTKYEVSNFARELLQKIHYDPLFDIQDLNPSLYKRFRVLEGLKDIRQQLHFFKTFMLTCRKANELAETFRKLPDHICSDSHLYSIHDLLQARNGRLLLFLRSLALESLNHITHCQLCLAKGFICEYCKDGDDVIFPFQLNRVVQCSGCRASFHKNCFVEGKCPKCERIRIRKQLLKQPVSPEEDLSKDSFLR